MFLIKNTTIVDGTGSAPESGKDILFDEKGIKEIAPTGKIRVPDQTEVIHGERKAVLPGLIDTHIHMDLHGYADTYDENRVEDKLRAIRSAREMSNTLKSGFTTIRNVGSVNGIDFAVKSAIEEGLMLGPRILTSGRIISMTARGNDYFLGLYREADGPDEVRKAAREQLKAGADFLKLMATGAVMNPGGVPGAPQLDIDEIRTIVEEADKLGTHVAAHAHGAVGIKNAVKAGVRTIEHGTYLDEEGIELMLKNGTYLVPTPVVGYHMLAHRDEGVPEHMLSDHEHEEKSADEAFLNAIRAGVKICYGTDTGTNYNYHGLNALQLTHFVRDGIYTPIEAIHCATLASAEAIGLDESVGSIETGKYADLIVLDEGILKDLQGLENAVQMVFLNGERVKG